MESGQKQLHNNRKVKYVLFLFISILGSCNGVLSMRKVWGLIKDPIFGYIHISEMEKKILDTFPFQRLRRIKQLAGTEFVYPGANHTRFEHSLGVMHLAGILAEQLHIDDVEKVKIASLLHDIGHGPFSHTFEPLLIKNLGKTHENMGSWIIKKTELADILEAEGFNTNEISLLAVGKSGVSFLDQIISSAVDVDKFDFIVRDSYHTGAEYGVDIFRLIYTMDVLEGNIAVNISALSTLEAFLIARVESFRSIYFHKVSRAAQVMLLKAMELANDELGLTTFDSPKEYMNMDDYTVWTKLRECEASAHLLKKIEKRELLKCAFEKTIHTKDELFSSMFTNERFLQEMEEKIAEKAKICPERITIDVPTLPSVPYSHSIQLEPMEIPAFSVEKKTGKKIPQRLTEISQIIEVLRGFMNIIRVYTPKEHRSNVEEAAKKIFDEIPFSARISA